MNSSLLASLGRITDFFSRNLCHFALGRRCGKNTRADVAVQKLRELGRIFVAEGMIDQAILCRRQAVERDPSNPQWRMELLRELLLAGRVEEARRADGQSGLVWRMLARELTKENRAELAQDCWRRALELDSSDGEAHLELVRALLTKGRVTEARDLAATLDGRTFPQADHRRQYKDFTPEEKCTAIEAHMIGTLASPEAIIELIRAVGHVLRNRIDGAFVECGVFRGGNAVVIIRTLLNAGVTDRDIYLYDTFAGMPKPEEIDYEYFVGPTLETWKKFKRSDESDDGSDWLRYPLEEVQERVRTLGYPAERIHFVKGLVENTIPQHIPEKIALLRLDTDFYRSTKHELSHLFPRLARGGILFIDDYGAMRGSRVASDEYFGEHKIPFFFGRVDENVRVGVRP